MFFGVTKNTSLKKGMENLVWLKAGAKHKLNFEDLGMIHVDNISNLLSKNTPRTKLVENFMQKGMATLTLRGDFFRHNPTKEGLNTHTIGLFINKNPNNYFYKAHNQVYIFDSLGETKPELVKIHNKLINEFIKKIYPNAEVVVNKKPQQIDGSFSCLNWTLANLKVAKENAGQVDIVKKLPKPRHYKSILKEQKIISENAYGKNEYLK